MRFLLLLQLLTSALAQLSSYPLASLLLLNQYGKNNNNRRCYWARTWSGQVRRRCRKSDNNFPLLSLALLSAFKPTPAPAAAPASPPGCFPDAMLFERETEDGSEMLPVANLTLGDNVRCLKAARGPRTAVPEVGWCKFIVRGHNLDTPLLYDQVYFFDERGQQQMIAATSDHLMWSSKDSTLKGPVDPSKISVQNGMFVPISLVVPGDVIIHEIDGKWTYRTVVEHRREMMPGVRNPSFSDGGLPLVNGVLATTSASFYRGGHWGTYFQNLWNQDLKFANTSQAYQDAKSHPFTVAQKKGLLKVDTDCLIDHVLADIDEGIDASASPSYEEYAKAYVLPCLGELPTLEDVGKVLMDDFEKGEFGEHEEGVAHMLLQPGAKQQIQPFF